MTAIPTLRFEVMLDGGLLDEPEDVDYTDFSDRVRGLRLKRGRSDQLGTFTAGTATLILDNSDGLLDPQNPSSLVHVGSGEGLPMSPARLMVDWDGDAYPLMARAWLGGDPWRVTSSPHGTDSTVLVELLDPMAAASWVDMPFSLWREIVRRIDPEWWIPGVAFSPFDSPDVGFVLPNQGTSGGSALLEQWWEITADPPLLQAGGPLTFLDAPDIVDPTQAYQSGLISVSKASPSMILKPFSLIASNEADIFPDGDEAGMTVSFFWQPRVDLVPEVDPVSTIARCADVVSEDLRWLLKIDTDNDNTLKLDVYDDAGTLLTQLVAADPASGSWLDGAPHGFVIRIEGGVAVDFFADDQQITETVDVPDAAHEGRLWLGTVQDAAGYVLEYPSTWPAFDELIVVPRLLDDTTCARIATAPATPDTWGRGETIAERMELWFDATSWPAGVDAEDEWHPPPAALADPDPVVTMAGVGESGGWPSTLSAAVLSTASAVGGDAYALRDGRIRVRSLLAVSDATYATTYDTASVTFTDEPTPAGPLTPIRRGPVEFSGVRLDRVVTEAQITYPLGVAVQGTSLAATIVVTGPASRYGRRRRALNIGVAYEAVARALGDEMIDRYEVPPVEIGAVKVSPLLGHPEWDDAVAWLLDGCELEAAVEVVDTRPGQTARTLELQVQGEEWDWSPAGLTVTLNLAKS